MKMVASLTHDVKLEVVKHSFESVAEIAAINEVRIKASQFISPLQLSCKQV